MEEKYETLYYIYKNIKYNTFEEVEKVIQEERYEEIWQDMWLWFKTYIYVFLILQILYNILGYICEKMKSSPQSIREHLNSVDEDF